MANNTASNYTAKLLKVFAKSFESSRVLTKTVETQHLKGKLTPATGGSLSIKRPHDYISHSTAGGDISGETKSDILSGKATATVQNYLTTATEWSNLEEALELDQLDSIIAPMATRLCTDLEVNLAEYMRNNCNLSSGVPDQPVDAWSDVAACGSLMNAVGVPMDSECYYVMDPFTQQNLADVQKGLSSGANSLVDTAWGQAQVANNVGGMKCITSNALKSFTSGSLTDRAGAINGTPTVTYVGHKDTMIQSIPVDGFAAGSDTIKAGEVIEITGRFRLNQSTREMALGADGAGIKWRGTVTADVTLSSGAGTLTVAGPAIYESGGQYNTTDTALADGDVVTILGTAATVYQPNLFYKKDAFGLGFVSLPKLYSTDTIYKSKDGVQIRCSKYADGDTNTQKIRFDVVPVFATWQPFFAGQGFGIA